MQRADDQPVGKIAAMQRRRHMPAPILHGINSPILKGDKDIDIIHANTQRLVKIVNAANADQFVHALMLQS
jgi:hypothetical protein